MTELRSLIDRVLSLKAQQDDLSEDIRQVYAEAQASRFNKTTMGQVVAYLRKREKGRAKLEDSEAIFESYLAEYDHGTIPAREDTHAHEAADLPPHDSDGVIIEEPETAQPVTVGEAITVVGNASPTVSEPAVAESAPAEAGQGERPKGIRLPEPGLQLPSVAPPIHSVAVLPSTDSPVVEPESLSVSAPTGASISASHAEGPGIEQPLSALPGSDFPELPKFLDRSEAA